MRRPVQAIRAQARVDQRGRKGRIRGTVWMFVQRPNRVRFDAMTQFGPALILTSDGEHFALTDLRERRFLEGPACPSNIARLLGIFLSGEETAQLLLGGVPQLVGYEQTSVRCIGDGMYRLELVGPQGHQQSIDLAVRAHDLNAPIEEQRLRLMRVELRDPQGETLWQVSYDAYQVIPVPGAPNDMGVAMPMRVHFVQPGFDTLIRFEEIVLNPEIPPEVFTQDPTPGMQVEQVLCE